MHPALCPHRLFAALLWLSALGFGLAVVPVSAQVLRCQDPATGQLTYTDGACPKGQATTTIAPARSAADIAQDRQHTETARARWHAEQLRIQQSQAIQTAPAALPDAPPARSAACAAAQSELQSLGRSNGKAVALEAAQRHMEMQCLGPAAYADLERSRANALAPGETTVLLPQPPRSNIARPQSRPPAMPVQRLNCNVFRCFDQHGNALPAPSPGQVR